MGERPGPSDKEGDFDAEGDGSDEEGVEDDKMGRYRNVLRLTPSYMDHLKGRVAVDLDEVLGADNFSRADVAAGAVRVIDLLKDDSEGAELDAMEEFRKEEWAKLDTETAVTNYANSTLNYLTNLYASGIRELDQEVGEEDVDLLIEEMIGEGIRGLDDFSRDDIKQILMKVHERARVESEERAEELAMLSRRSGEIRASIERGAKVELLSPEEKQRRAEEISIDALPTSKDEALKAQSDAGRAEFVVRIVKEFDEKGWTLPENLMQVSPNSNDNATEYDIERYEFIGSIAEEVKDELMPDFT